MEGMFYNEALDAVCERAGGNGYEAMTRNMTLNLHAHAHDAHTHAHGDALASPDLQLLKLSSPELERLIAQSCSGLAPKHATDEQEGFADGFVRALAEFHGHAGGLLGERAPPPPPPPPLETPPLSPIDMEDQERIKAERKRVRNRVAASKCRKRKLERLARLEERVSRLAGENGELRGAADALRDQVAQLRNQLLDHVKCGCAVLGQQLHAVQDF